MNGNRLLWASAAAAGVTAMLLAAQATSLYGVGINTDSVGYIEDARDIARRGMAFLREDRAVAQPPGYPLVLAGGSLVASMDIVRVARLLSIGCAGLLVVLAALNAGRLTASRSLLVLAPALVALALPVLAVCKMAWSEPLFMVIASLVLTLATFVPLAGAWTVALGLLTGAAFLTRYAGIVLVPTVGAAILCRAREPLGKKWLHAGLYGAVALLPVVLYAVRNRTVSGTFLGDRLPAASGTFLHLVLAARTVSDWFFPGLWRAHPLLGMGLWVSLLLAPGCFRRRIAARFPTVRATVIPHGLFVLSYGGFIVLSSSLVVFDPIDTRLLAPLFPSLAVLLVFVFAPETYGCVRGVAAAALATAMAVLFIAAPGRQMSRDVRRFAREGAGGYSTVAWREGRLMKALCHAPPRGERVFSNAPDALSVLAGLDAEMVPPYRAGYADRRSPVTPETLFRAYPRMDGALIAWFHRKNRPHVFTPKMLAEAGELQLVGRYDDGDLYRMLTTAPECAPWPRRRGGN